MKDLSMREHLQDCKPHNDPDCYLDCDSDNFARCKRGMSDYRIRIKAKKSKSMLPYDFPS